MNILSNKNNWLIIFISWAGLAIASPPSLPITGYLTDQKGDPLNENQTVTLTFSTPESATSDEPLWTEQHNKVTLNQGRFVVLLGEKKKLLKDDGSAIDFTQKKYIKVNVKAEINGKEEFYTLTPPLIYMPTLGTWQAVHADKTRHAIRAEHTENTEKLETHGWNDIQNINNSINLELVVLEDRLKIMAERLEKLRDILNQANQQIETKNSQLNTLTTDLNQANQQIETKNSQLNTLTTDLNQAREIFQKHQTEYDRLNTSYQEGCR